MIKVLHVTHTYLPYIGGSSLRMRNLIEPISNDCEIHLLATRVLNDKTTKLADFETINGIHVHRVDKQSDVIKAIKKICKEANIDIIHAHNPRFAFFSMLAFARKPIIFEIHALRQLSMIKAFITGRLYSICSKIIVLSISMKQTLINDYGIAPDKIEIIYNGIDLNKFIQQRNREIIKAYGVTNEPVVGYLGTFYDWQGVIDLVQAFSLVAKKRDDAKLLMVGDGPEFQNVKNIVHQLGIENRVILTGKVQPEETPNYISAMDIFMIPRPKTSATETAVPLKLLEAMAVGKPIIATRLQALLEVLNENVNAVIAEPNDIDDIANAILKLLNDKELQKILGNNARKTVEEKFSWDISSKSILQCYKDLMDEK